MFRRMGRRLIRRTLNPGDFGDFFNARRLQEAGQPEQAALAFMQLAQQKAGRRPRQCANLHAQAAHAWLDAGVEPRALNQARTAMQMFSQLGMRRRAAEFRQRFAGHLRQKNASAAEVFENEFGIPAMEQPVSQVNAQRGRLPAECPKCGAPVSSDEVEWMDDFSAECDFCGATLQVEG